MPAGTQHGATLSLPRHGLPRLGGPAAAAGSHHFKVAVLLPLAEELGEREREVLGQLAGLQGRQGRRPRGQQPGGQRQQHQQQRGAAAAAGSVSAEPSRQGSVGRQGPGSGAGWVRQQPEHGWDPRSAWEQRRRVQRGAQDASAGAARSSSSSSSSSGAGAAQQGERQRPPWRGGAPPPAAEPVAAELADLSERDWRWLRRRGRGWEGAKGVPWGDEEGED